MYLRNPKLEAICLLIIILFPLKVFSQEPIEEWIAIPEIEAHELAIMNQSFHDLSIDEDWDFRSITRGRIIKFKATKSKVGKLKESIRFKAIGPMPTEKATMFEIPPSPLGNSFTLDLNSAINPTDTYFSQQWYLNVHPFGVGWFNSSSAEAGALIADIDSGTALGFPDTSDNLTNLTYVGQEFTGSHGTFMSSMIVNKTDNNFGTASVSPNSPMMIWNVCPTLRGADLGWILKAIFSAADSGAKILMLEFHYPDGTDPFTVMLLQEAIYYANSKGMLITGSCGNESRDTCTVPSSLPEVVTISASGKNGHLIKNDIWGSNWQKDGEGQTEFCTPAELTVTMSEGGYFGIQDTGTSGAQAMFAGIASRVWGHFPHWNSSQVLIHIAATATKAGVDSRCGHGIPNIAAATATSIVQGRISKLKDGAFTYPNGAMVRSNIFGSGQTNNNGYYSFQTVEAQDNEISVSFFADNLFCSGKATINPPRDAITTADIVAICQPIPHKNLLPVVIKQ